MDSKEQPNNKIVKATETVLDSIALESNPQGVRRQRSMVTPGNKSNHRGLPLPYGNKNSFTKRSISNIEQSSNDKRPKYLTNSQKTIRPPGTASKFISNQATNKNSPRATTVDSPPEDFQDSTTPRQPIPKEFLTYTTCDIQKIMTTIEESNLPQSSELLLRTLERHLEDLQTLFMEKFETINQKIPDCRRKRSYKFVTLIEGDSAKLVLNEADAKRMPDMIPVYSMGDFELKLKQSFTDFMSSFVDRVKVYLKETSQKDFEEMMKLFEQEQNLHCSVLLDWLSNKCEFVEADINKEILEQFQIQIDEANNRYERALREYNVKIHQLTKDAEIREANLLTESDAKINKILIQMGELEKSKLSIEQKYNEAIQRVENDRNALINVVKTARSKHSEITQTQEEKIEFYEKTNEDLKAKIKTFQELLQDISASVEEERQKCMDLKFELCQAKRNEKELQKKNTELTEKLQINIEAQGDKIQNLMGELDEMHEHLQKMRNENRKLTEKVTRMSPLTENDTIRSLQKDLNESLEKNESLQESKKSLEENLAKQLEDNKNLANFKLQCDEYQTKVDELQEFISILKEQLESSEKEGTERTYSFNVYEKQLENLQNLNKKLTEQLQNKDQKENITITSLLKDLSESREENRRLQEVNGDLVYSRAKQKLEEKSRYTEIKDQLDESQKKVQELQTFNSILKEKLEKVENEKTNCILQFTSKINEDQKQLEKLETIKNELTVKLSSKASDKSVTKLLEELNESHDKIKNLEKINAELASRLIQQEQEDNAILEDLKLQLDDSQKNMEDLRGINLILEEKLETAEREKIASMAQFTYKLNENQERANELKYQNSKLEKNIENLRKEKDNTISRLLLKFQEGQGRIHDLQTINNNLSEQLQNEFVNNENKVKYFLNELNKSQEKVKNLQNVSNELTEKLDEANGVIENLESEKFEIEQNLLQLNEEKEQTVVKLLTDLHDSQEDLKDLRKLNENLKAKCEKLQEDKKIIETETQSRLEELKRENNNLKEQYEKLNREKFVAIKRITTEINESRQNLKDLRRINSDLRTKIKKFDQDRRSTIERLVKEINDGKDCVRKLQFEDIELREKLLDLELEKNRKVESLQAKLEENSEIVKCLQRINIQLKEEHSRQSQDDNTEKELLRKDLDENKAQIVTLKALNDELSQKVKGTVIENEEKSFTIARLINELDETQERLKELQSCNGELEEKLEKQVEDCLKNAQLLEELSKSRTKVLDLESQINILEDRLKSVDEEKENLNNELHESRQRIEDLQQLNTNLIVNLSGQAKTQALEIENLQNELNESQERVIGLQALNNKLAEHIQGQGQFQSDEIDRLQKELKASLIQIKELTMQLNSQNEKSAHLQEKLDESRTRVQDLELVYVELSKKLEEEDQDETIAEELLNELIESRKMVKELEILNEELTRKLQIQENRDIVGFTNEIARLQSEKHELRISIDEHLEKLSECNTAISALKEVLARKDETVELKSKHIESLRNEIQELLHDLETVREMVISKNKQIRRLESKLTTSSEHFKTLFNTFGHKHAECYEMETKCRVMQDAINRANKIRKTQDETINLLNNKIQQLTSTIQTFQIQIPANNTSQAVDNESILPAAPRRRKRNPETPKAEEN